MENLQQRQAFAPPSSVHPVEFRGQAMEYFRIWIVNLVLSIITLGIYSAWATVRTRRYFYGNTIVDGSSFDYHATPQAILKGRVIAAVVLLAYYFGDVIHIAIIPIVFLLVAAVFPWLYRAALGFRRRMTSYRNVRFNFTGTTGQSYLSWSPAYLLVSFYLLIILLPPTDPVAFLGAFFMLLIAILVAIPMVQFLTNRYAITNSYFGQQQMTATFVAGDFAKIFLQTIGVNIMAGLGVSIVLGLIIGLLGGLEAFSGTIEDGSSFRFLMFVGGIYLLYGIAFTAGQAFWIVARRNLIASHTRAGNLLIHSRMDFWDYWPLIIGNLLAILLTLGLAYPWARIRLAKYHAETLQLEGDIEGFVAVQAEAPGAYGQEMAEMLDLDIGL